MQFSRTCFLAFPVIALTTLGFTPAHAQAPPNSQMAVVLQTLASIEGQPFYTLSPQDARQQFSAEDAAKIVARQHGVLKPEPVGKIVDQFAIPGLGGSIPVRIYTPAGSGPFPVIVYFHGGGFVIATLDTYDASARALTNLTGAVVVSVEYRKAPEHPYPAALLDAITAYLWAVSHSSFLHGIPGKIAVAGESAGGNLATEVCLNARNYCLPLPLYQLLVYPITNDDPNTPSKRTYANAQPLNVPALQFFSQNTYQNPANLSDPNAFPLKANLKGLPPATLIAAEIDPLQSEGAQYAQALEAAGARVRYRFYAGVTHEFFGMGAVIATARQAESDAAADLTANFRMAERVVNSGHESLLGGPAGAGGRRRASRRPDVGRGGPVVSNFRRQRGPLRARPAHGTGLDPGALQRAAPPAREPGTAGGLAGPTLNRA